MTTVAVVGGQWGDEGKGKVVDLLSEDAAHVVRCQGGANAGHTIVIGAREFKLHLVPTGILHPDVQCYLGAGVVLDMEALLTELRDLQAVGIQSEGRFWISPYTHVVMPYHKEQDARQEQRRGRTAIGTTSRGIGPCYADKAHRTGFRFADVLDTAFFREQVGDTLSSDAVDSLIQHAEQLRPHLGDVEERLFLARQRGERIVFEGAQGVLLDSTFGTYPYVTSSHTCAAGVCQGAGLGPSSIDETLLVLKAYCTRVGHGPFPTEDNSIFAEDCASIREVGTTTGRTRRLGWFDAVLGRWSVQLNGADAIVLTKLDILDTLEIIKICVGYTVNGEERVRPPVTQSEWESATPIYEEWPGWQLPTVGITDPAQLPEAALAYIQRIAELCGAPVFIVSVGPARDQTLTLRPQVQEAT